MKKIQILGSGCTKCNKLAHNAREAADNTGIAVEIEKLTEPTDFIKFGCMTTPGLVIDGTLVSQGKLLKPAQIAELLQ